MEESEKSVDGKVYTLWNQFVEQKGKWIGGVLEDHDMGQLSATEITDITLEPNGKDSAMFSVEGKEWGCGFDVRHGGISEGEKGWITFSGYAGHKWRIKQLDTN